MIKNYWLDKDMENPIMKFEDNFKIWGNRKSTSASMDRVGVRRWLMWFEKKIRYHIYSKNEGDVVNAGMCLFLESKDRGFSGYKCMTTKWSEDENFEYIVFSFDVETKLSFKIPKVII